MPRRARFLRYAVLAAILALPALTVTNTALAAGPIAAGPIFEAQLSGEQEVAVPDPGLIENADVVVRFDAALTEVDVTLMVRGGANVTGAHFHCALPGENGSLVFGLFSPGPLVFDGRRAEGVLINADVSVVDCNTAIGRPVNNIAALAFAMHEGLIYANVHTTDNPAGEVRGQMAGLQQR